MSADRRQQVIDLWQKTCPKATLQDSVQLVSLLDTMILQEREACAQVASAHCVTDTTNTRADWYKHGQEIAREILKRGKK